MEEIYILAFHIIIQNIKVSLEKMIESYKLDELQPDIKIRAKVFIVLRTFHMKVIWRLKLLWNNLLTYLIWEHMLSYRINFQN